MKISNNINNNVSAYRAKQNNQKPSFNSLAALDKGALFVADAIENGGLAVSFTLQDMLGTNLPRPIMGLMRNKNENKGQANKSFAAKELVREMTTGPSMFIIPAGMLAFAKKVFGKTVNVPAKVIKSLNDIHASSPLNIRNQAISQQEFYQNAFAQIIKNAKSETQISQQTLDKAAQFAKTLAENVNDKNKFKEATAKIASEFVEISKKFAKDPAYTDFTSATLSNNVSVNIKDAISHISSYADDIVAKAQGQDPSKITAFIKKISDKKIVGRFAMNALMYAAIMAFLQIIPKMYNKAEGKDNAGLKGLMKQETLKDSSLDQTKKTQEQQDKSKPSFGSSASMAKALTDNGLMGKIANSAEFSGCNLSFPLLVGVMLFGILAPRVKNSKDKYDREEILRRDVVTCAVMCAGEKELRKGFSKLNEHKSGFVLATKDKGFKDKSILKRIFDYLRPEKGVNVLSTDQIVSKYSNIAAYKDGLKGFCEFIDAQGGNLSKVLSYTDESKTIIESMLQKEGKTLAGADNKIIKEVIEKAKDSPEAQKLVDLFKDKNNPWVTKAKTLNARFTALSVLVLVPVFLGFMLPWINEKATKKKFAMDNAVNDKTKMNNNNLSYLEEQTPDTFKDFAAFI